MARKDYEAEKGNVSSLTSWQQQVGRFSQLFTKWLLKSHTKPWWTYITGCTGYEVGYNIKFDFMCESATLPLRFITNSTWKKTMIENKWVLAHGVKKRATHGSSVKNKLHKLVWTLAILLITTSVLCVCACARARDRQRLLAPRWPGWILKQRSRRHCAAASTCLNSYTSCSTKDNH